MLDSFGKLAAPRIARASETSRKTLVPIMGMLPTRGHWHKSHLSRILLLRGSSRMCNCDQRHCGFGVSGFFHVREGEDAAAHLAS
jgi:hypothetical protein